MKSLIRMILGWVWVAMFAFAAAAQAQLSQPLLFSSPADNKIYKWDGVSAPTTFIDTSAQFPGVGPYGLAFDNNQTLYVSAPGDFGSNPSKIVRYNAMTGAFIDVYDVGQQFRQWNWLTVGPDGAVYVSDWNNGGVRRYTGPGTYTQFVASGGADAGSNDMIFGPDGNFWVSNSQKNSVRRYNGTTGAYMNDVIAPGADPFLFGANGLALNGSELLVGEGNQSRVIRFDWATGASLGYLATTGLNWVQGVAVGPDDGKIYVASVNNDDVLRFNFPGPNSLDATITSSIDSFELVFVPEPSSAVLIGLGVLVALRRRK